MSQGKKVFYKISEVSQITSVEEHKLRYWESKIGMLKPRRIEGNQRFYTKKEIKLIQKIQFYLEKGVKLEALNSYLLGRRKNILKYPAELNDFSFQQKVSSAEKVHDSEPEIFSDQEDFQQRTGTEKASPKPHGLLPEIKATLQWILDITGRDQ